MLGEVVSGLSIWDRLFKFWKNRNKPELESVATHFVRLFESHGVHRNQIPRFFGFNLTIADVKDDETLLLKLSEEMLDAACEMFAVRREWLDGAESQVYNLHDFYKHPEDCVTFIEKIKANNPDNYIHDRLLTPKEKDFRANAVVIIEETVGYIGDKAICRYHICNNWPFTYWKARAYLTACIAILWQRRCSIHGVILPAKVINKITYGEELLGWNGEGVFSLQGLHWHPDDMADRPDVFLKDIDSERDNFGLKSALQLWLDLESEGYMDVGFGAVPRASFEKALLEVY